MCFSEFYCFLLIICFSCQIAGILSSVKVDVVILGEMLEMVYEDLERQGESMTFERLSCTKMHQDLPMATMAIRCITSFHRISFRCPHPSDSSVDFVANTRTGQVSPHIDKTDHTGAVNCSEVALRRMIEFMLHLRSS
jgi:hypothetical protein